MHIRINGDGINRDHGSVLDWYCPNLDKGSRGWHLQLYTGNNVILLVSEGPIDQANELVNALRAEKLLSRLSSPLDVDKGIRLGWPKVKSALYLYNRERAIYMWNYAIWEIIWYMNQPIEAQNRKNVGGTIAQQERSDCAITDRSW
jgi:hypothetical protein